MIKDVKSYINSVGNRLSNAFSMEAFGTEEQLEFWELAAEHVSRKGTPAFGDIVKWVDMLYRAPVHFVYKLKDEKLVLARRHVIAENVLENQRRKKTTSEQSTQEKELQQDFEYQLENLEKKMKMDKIFLEHGITAHSIGQCEHIPLFTKQGDFWGIYCAGPYTKSPDQITPKLSIAGRLISGWLISLEEEEKHPQKEYEKRIQEITSELGSGKMNAEALAQLNLRYLVNALKAEGGCIIEFSGNAHNILAHNGLEESKIKGLNASGDALLIEEQDGGVKVTAKGTEWLKELGQNPDVMYFKGEYHSGCILLFECSHEPQSPVQEVLETISTSFATILDYRNQNERFSNKLMAAYYRMLRSIEKNRDKTFHHTPRMVAFVQRFGMLFGLEDHEMQIISQTAKLHDIGYVGAKSIEPDKTIGGELTHSLIGANLIEQLAVHPDVVEGIKTHHEWVNGNGTPAGLKGEDIPWTGKIIGVFEYVVDFVETHGPDQSKSDEEWIEKLSNGLVQRADIEFDMVLIPTVIQLIQALGWQGCVNLGVS